MIYGSWWYFDLYITYSHIYIQYILCSPSTSGDNNKSMTFQGIQFALPISDVTRSLCLRHVWEKFEKSFRVRSGEDISKPCWLFLKDNFGLDRHWGIYSVTRIRCELEKFYLQMHILLNKFFIVNCIGLTEFYKISLNVCVSEQIFILQQWKFRRG